MAIAETHYYDVTTRYRVIEGGAAASMGRMDRATAGAARSAGQLSHFLAFMPYQFALIARLGAVFAGPVAFLAGMYKGMKAVNQEMETSLSMTAIISASLHNMYSMQERWNIATQQTAKHYAQIAIDAASLPGELKDFTMASQLVMGPIMQAHAGQQASVALRANEKLIGNLSIVRTAFGIDPQTAGRQAQFMLGGMGRKQQRLFQMLQPFGIGAPAEFNALSATDRFKRLDEAMAKIAENPLVRKRVFGLLETQMGTFSDAMFGPRGIFGILGQFPLESFISGLKMINRIATTIADKLQTGGRMFGYWDSPEAKSAYDTLYSKYNLDTAANKLTRTPQGGMLTQEIQRVAMRAARERALMEAHGDIDLYSITARKGTTSEKIMAPLYDKMSTYYTEHLKVLKNEGYADGLIAGVPDSNVQQTIYATIDVKTDDSPEAVALKLEKGFAMVARRPTTPGRANPLLPKKRSIGPATGRP